MNASCEELLTEIRLLRSEVASLKVENTRLREENAHLREQLKLDSKNSSKNRQLPQSKVGLDGTTALFDDLANRWTSCGYGR